MLLRLGVDYGGLVEGKGTFASIKASSLPIVVHAFAETKIREAYFDCEALYVPRSSFSAIWGYGKT